MHTRALYILIYCNTYSNLYDHFLVTRPFSLQHRGVGKRYDIRYAFHKQATKNHDMMTPLDTVTRLLTLTDEERYLQQWRHTSTDSNGVEQWCI